jgi:site-specific DNA recombinase
MKDFIYYRCSGSDGYRFGGEAICSNKQVQGKFLEAAVWNEVCALLRNPQRLEQEYQDRNCGRACSEGVETLKAQRVKLQHALERLIDSFTEGLIDKTQFTSRMSRTKNRISDLDGRIKDNTGDVELLENLRLETRRLQELAVAVGPDLASADWHRRREIIRTLVQRIDIETEVIKIIFRVSRNTRVPSSNSIAITLSRP